MLQGGGIPWTIVSIPSIQVIPFGVDVSFDGKADDVPVSIPSIQVIPFGAQDILAKAYAADEVSIPSIQVIPFGELPTMTR